jgi:hypothetical protein
MQHHFQVAQTVGAEMVAANAYLNYMNTFNNKLVVQPLRGLDAFSAPQQKRYMVNRFYVF